MKSWSRIDWLNLALFGLLVTLFYWRIITPSLADRQSFPPGDFQAQFWAFTTYEVRELSAGRLPLWNPYTFAGAPFWADVQSAVFYPPSILTILLSAPWGFSLFALEIEAIAHFWLAATFMYLFIRDLTRNRAAAVVAALTFTFSGYLTGYPSQQLAVLEADVWLPLILFFIYRASQTTISNEPLPINHALSANPPNSLNPPHAPNSYLLLAGVAWGLTLLAGHPQSALIVVYISSAYFFFLWFSSYPIYRFKFRTLFRSIVHWLVFLGTGLGLAAIQFIPAVEYTILSVRAEGTYDNMSGGFPISDVIQVLLPGQVSLYSPLYVGIVGLILALWVIFAVPNRHIIFWTVVALITFLVSFGGNTFLYSPLYLFAPGLSIFRGQERWAFATAFSLSVLVGYGFSYLMDINYALAKKPGELNDGSREQRAQRWLSRATLYLLFFALFLDLLFFFGLNETGWTPDSPFYGLFGASTLLTLLLGLTWLLWTFSSRLKPTIFAALAAGVICLDLFSVNWQTNLYAQLPEWHTRQPDAITAIKNDAAQFSGEPYRVYNEFRIYDNYGVPFEIEDMWGASPLRPDRYDKLLAPPMPIERIWALLNVRYVITWREELYVPSTIIYQEPASDGRTYVHRLESVGPRAWLTYEAEVAADPALLQKIGDADFDLWQVALFEPEAASSVRQIDPATPDQVADHAFKVSRVASHGSYIKYDIFTPSSAYFILSEAYYPGWQATIDGQPAPLLRADYVLRAIPVPAGEHIVELSFRPLSFFVGTLVTALTVAVLCVVFIAGRLKKRSIAPKTPEID